MPLNKIIKLFGFFLWPVYFVSRFIKRDNNIFLFGSMGGKRFADNPKYLYLILSNYYKIENKKYIWISRNKEIVDMLKSRGFSSYYLYSIKSFYYLFKAKYYVFDISSNDIFFWFSGGSIKINLWHGIPLKKIAYDEYPFSRYKFINSVVYLFYKIFVPWRYEKISCLLATSDEIKNIFSSSFRIPKDKIIVSNYPRNVVMLNNIKGEEVGISIKDFYIIAKYKEKGYKIIIYLPTFRGNTGDDFDKYIRFRILNEFCVKNRIVFAIKEHPMCKINLDTSDLSNIMRLGKYNDIYPFLRISDALITDYSSVFFDYYLTQKPIIFFWYDLKEYLSKERDVYFDYNKVCVGYKVFNFEELLICLDQIFTSKLRHQKQVEKILEIFFAKKDDIKNMDEILEILNIR